MIFTGPLGKSLCAWAAGTGSASAAAAPDVARTKIRRPGEWWVKMVSVVVCSNDNPAIGSAPNPQPGSCGGLANKTATLVHAGPVKEGRAIYDRFLAAFVAGNQTAIAALFAPDAQFYGTSSGELVTVAPGVQKYFDVLKTVPPDTRASSLGNSVLAVSDDVAVVSGM